MTLGESTLSTTTKTTSTAGILFQLSNNIIPKIILHLNTIPTLNTLGSECKCDDRGTQKNAEDGDWCSIKEIPCKLLTGDHVTSGTWIRCHQKDDPTSQELIKCPRDNPGKKYLDLQ